MAIRPILLFCFCFFLFFAILLKSLFKIYIPEVKENMLHARNLDIFLKTLKEDKTVLHATHLTVEDGLTEMPSRAGVPQGSVFNLLILSSTSPPLENLHDPSLSAFFSSPLPTSALFSCLSLHLGPLIT